MGSWVPSGRLGPLLCEGAASPGDLEGESMLFVSYPFGSSIPMSQWCAALAMAAYPRRASCLSATEGSSAS
eukprot:5244941-Pyramimonas_sp.AAC.1